MPTKTVRDYMTQRLVSVGPDTDIHEAIALLVREEISGMPVVDERGAAVGVLSEKDGFKTAFGYGYHQDRGGPVRDYMTQPAVTVDADMDVMTVIDRFRKGPYRRFPVVAGGRVVGVISRRDALRAILELW
jgi:CBS domain-containing protein